MRFPDDVTILRPTAADAYGNDHRSFANAQEIPVRGFHVRADLLLLPKDTPARPGDRYRIGTDTYAGEIVVIRSPSGAKLAKVDLTRVED